MQKKGSKTLILFLTLTLLSLFFVWLSRFAFIGDFRGFLGRPFLGVERVIFATRQSLLGKLVFLKNWRLHYKQRLNLEKQIRVSAIQSGDLAACLEENAAMRRLLGAPLPPSWHFIPAKAIGEYERLKINIGEKAGVKPGLMVISENVLVGKVERVEKYFSLVVLAADPGLKIPVIVRSPQKAGIIGRGILSGYSKEQFVLEELLKSEAIDEGDLVFTSGEGEWLPDLMIGQIEKIEESQGKVFKKAWVASLVDWQNLRNIFVVKDR